ncbi:hypothetical protein NQU96_11700 [Pseudoalteromonas elyakovii]|nr:hypothetical protein [Pseudoalteromonas elyakovii]
MTVPLPLPKRPKRSNFKLVPNSQVHLNKANNATEVYDLEGAYWEFEIELANVPEREALALDAFIASLRGQVGTFTLFDYRREQLDKGFTGYVRGENQDGNTLVIDGLPLNQTLLVAGERMQVGVGQNTELKILTGDLVSDSLGRATVVFESPLRKIPADNTLITFKQPRGLFRLADNNQGIYSAEYKKGIVTSWKIKGREAF